MHSCIRTLKFSLFLASILMLFAFSTSNDSKDKQECAQALVGLATCLPYVGGDAKAPTPDCCTGLKAMMKTKTTGKCLCLIIKDRNDPDYSSLNINVTLAFSLLDVCKAPANKSQCPALLNLPPNSPDAQIFYQLGKNSTHSSASSPVAGGPSPSVAVPPTPTSAATLGSPSWPKRGGFGQRKSKRWLGLEMLMAGLVLLPALIM